MTEASSDSPRGLGRIGHKENRIRVRRLCSTVLLSRAYAVTALNRSKAAIAVGLSKGLLLVEAMFYSAVDCASHRLHGFRDGYETQAIEIDEVTSFDDLWLPELLVDLIQSLS